MHNLPCLIVCYRRHSYLNSQIRYLVDSGCNSIYIASNNSPANSENIRTDVSRLRKNASMLSQQYPAVSFYLCFYDNHESVGHSIVRSITWFFSCVSVGLILEDDILISKSAYEFISCHIDNIPFQYGTVTAFSHYNPNNKITTSTSLTSLFSTLCWATTSSVWSSFSLSNPSNYQINKSSHFSTFSLFMRFMIKRYLNLVLKGKLNTWDFQFGNYLSNSQLYTLVPPFSLIAYVGLNDIYCEHLIKDNAILEHLSSFYVDPSLPLSSLSSGFSSRSAYCKRIDKLIMSNVFPSPLQLILRRLGLLRRKIQCLLQF